MSVPSEEPCCSNENRLQLNNGVNNSLRILNKSKHLRTNMSVNRTLKDSLRCRKSSFKRNTNYRSDNLKNYRINPESNKETLKQNFLKNSLASVDNVTSFNKSFPNSNNAVKHSKHSITPQKMTKSLENKHVKKGEKIFSYYYFSL